MSHGGYSYTCSCCAKLSDALLQTIASCATQPKLMYLLAAAYEASRPCAKFLQSACLCVRNRPGLAACATHSQLHKWGSTAAALTPACQHGCGGCFY